MRAALAASIADAPDGLGPLVTLFRGLRSVQLAPKTTGHSRNLGTRSFPPLPRYMSAKWRRWGLADALAAVLKARGVSDLQAVLAGRISMAAFVQATVSWLDDPKLGLGVRLDLAYRELKALFAG